MPDDLTQILIDRVKSVEVKVDSLAENVTKALTRLDHPDPSACTQQMQIRDLQDCNLRLFARTEKLEQWRAWMLGGMAILATLWVALLTAISSLLKLWKP